MDPKLKKHFFTAVKIIVSASAIIYLYRSIENKQAIVDAFLQANYFWLLPAFLFFNASKIISSVRLNAYFKCIGLELKEIFNLKLYYLGMFYNLFLPGGIGGDGYKVYYLNKHYDTKVKPLISATLLDRISGVVVLGFMLLLLLVFSTLIPIANFQNIAFLLAIGLLFPMFYWFHKKVFSSFQPRFFYAMIMGFGVQISQLIAAVFILLALNAGGFYLDYLCLFLLSSIVAVLPLTIGGIGARELVFLKGVVFFSSINQFENTAVLFSILFFLITALSSLIGIIYSVNLKND